VEVILARDPEPALRSENECVARVLSRAVPTVCDPTIPSRAHALEIDEADVRAYCTGEKPVARVVILALEGRMRGMATTRK